MLYIGLDIHWRMSVICILDENGKLIKFTTVHGPWSKVIEVLKGLKRPRFFSWIRFPRCMFPRWTCAVGEA